MKQIFYTMTFLMMSGLAFSQIAIGKETINGNSTLLDFDDVATNANGIILPAVNNISGALSLTPEENNGTFLFDKSDKKVKMYQNNIWVELSEAGNTDALTGNENTSTEVGGGVIIGAQTTSAAGVLVLESSDMAMILPRIDAPHENVKSPYPGMICFDTEVKALALFDGSKWNYWK